MQKPRNHAASSASHFLCFTYFVLHTSRAPGCQLQKERLLLHVFPQNTPLEESPLHLCLPLPTQRTESANNLRLDSVVRSQGSVEAIDLDLILLASDDQTPKFVPPDRRHQWTYMRNGERRFL